MKAVEGFRESLVDTTQVLEKRHAARLKVIGQVGRQIVSILNLDELLHRVVELLVESFGYYYANILLVDAPAGEIVLRASAGRTGRAFEGLHLKIGQQGITGWVAGAGQPLLVNDVSKEPRYHFVEELKDTRSELAVPIMLRGEVIGVLDVQSVELDAFGQDDVSILQTLADQLAIAIGNARLFEAEQHKRQVADTLGEISRIVASTLDLDEVLHLVLEQLERVLSFEATVILLLDEERDELYVRMSKGYPQEASSLRLPLSGPRGITAHVARTGEPIYVPDVSQDERYVSGGFDGRSEMAAPLKIKGKVIGVLNVESRQLDAYSENDLELLATLATQVSIAIENARLYQAERKRAAQLAVVNQVARQTASIFDLDQLLQEVVTAIQQGFEYHNVALFLLDETASELEMRAIAGGFEDVAAPDYRQAVGVGMIGWTAETGQPLLSNDVSQEPRYVPGFLEEVLTRSELCVPLKLAGQVIGVLDVEDTRLSAFDETDLLAMETLADQIAMAIENARLFGETSRRFEETTALYQTSLDITAQLEMTELLKSIVERAVTLLQAEAGGIYLYDPEREGLRLVISHDYTGKYVWVTLKPGEGMAGRVFQSGEAFIVDDYCTWEGRVAAFEGDQSPTTILGVPLKWQDQIIGVLAIDADARQRTFNQDDVWLATLFANQAVVAIENARIYEEERKRATQLELIEEITQKIASILNLDELLPQVAYLIGDTFGYYYTSILLVEAGSDELTLKAAAGPFMETLIGLRLKIGREGITGWVAHSGHPLLVNDVSREPKYYPTEVTKDTRSELAVPIKLKGEVIGVLDVQSVELDAFGQDDVSILQTLADQLAIAIRNARSYAETQQRAEQMAILYDTALDIAAKLEIRQLLQAIVERATDLLNGIGGAMYLYRPEQDDLELALIYKLKPDFTGTVLRRGEGLSGKVLESGQLMIVDCYREWSGRSPSYEGAPFEAVIALPVKWGDQILGIINVLREREAEAFDDQDVRLLTLFANQAAVAIENARLYEETRHRAERLAVLNHIASALSTTLNLDELLEVVHREVTAVMEADAFFIALYDRVANELDYRIQIDQGVREPPERRPLGLGLTSVVVTDKKPILIRDFEKEKDRYPQPRLWGAMEAPASWLGVPILFGDQVVGVISVQAYRPEAYGQEEQLLLTTITDQVAVAMENARLFEAEAQRGHEAETLRQAALALTSTLDLEEILDRILEQLHCVVAYDSASVQLLRDDHLEIVGGRGFANPSAVIGLRFPVPGDNPNTRVIESGEPVILTDAQAAHAPFREPPHDHIRSWLGVPMRFRDQIIGVIALDSTELGHFTADHARLATAFANQAAVAIENARLYKQVTGLAAELEVRVQERTSELVRKAQELAFLYQASVALSSSLEKDEVLNILARQAALAVGAVDCAIYELQDDAFVIVAEYLDPTLPWQDSDVGHRYLLAHYPATREALEKGQPLWVRVDDPLADEAERAVLQEWGYTALLMIQIVSQDQVVGIVEVFDNKPQREFSEGDAALLQTIANQAGMAIERARLYEETRRRAQEVAQQKEQTDAIVQSMADGLIVTDLENKLVLANPAAEELLKFRLEDATGQDIGANIRDDRLRQIVRDTLDKQQAGYEVDIELTDPYDGGQRVMRAHTAVVNDLAGQPMGIVTSLRDVTHEREVQRLKDELVSTVSHELRTPMSSVLGFSELLLTRQLSEEKRQLYIQTIHEEARRLSALINDFLDIQRMTRGQLEYRFEEVDLGELVREAVATYSGQSDIHTLTMSLAPDLPPVPADPDRLRQVFGNLLSNAIKFSPDGGMVAVSVQAEGDEIHIAVSDEGIGIPAEAMPHLFERFFRVDSSDRREIKGTGLGLAICKEIVEAHGGHIWAESPSTLRAGREGVGTTVTFSLPLTIKKRILVIDDEKDIDMFQKLLSEKDYEVLTAANGQEGLSLMERELPDLVIVDIAMPVMNGYQFLARMKEDRRMKDIPVIAISGVDTNIDRLKELGADEFLSKPFSNTVLLDTVWRLLKGS